MLDRLVGVFVCLKYLVKLGWLYLRFIIYLSIVCAGSVYFFCDVCLEYIHGDVYGKTDYVKDGNKILYKQQNKSGFKNSVTFVFLIVSNVISMNNHWM